MDGLIPLNIELYFHDKKRRKMLLADNVLISVEKKWNKKVLDSPEENMRVGKSDRLCSISRRSLEFQCNGGEMERKLEQ